MTDRRRDILIGLGLLLLPFCAFFTQALGQAVFYHHDYSTTSTPTTRRPRT